MLTAQAAARAATTLELLDFEVIAYNSFGGTVDPPDSVLSDLEAITHSRWQEFHDGFSGNSRSSDGLILLMLVI